MRRTLKALIGASIVLALAAGQPGFAAEEKKAEEKKTEEKKNDAGLTKNEYKGGFKLGSADGKFSMRIFSAIQLRYTYLSYDDSIRGNQTNYSNFFMRRARLWWDGHAYDPRFTYYFHLQLEPQGGVNLHDAWVEYKFNDNAILGVGRNKIAYGLEFLNSGFGLNFVERSIMYGETDVNDGGGLSKWPGDNATFGLQTLDANTGYPTGGLCLFRSQGIQLRGGKQAKEGFAWEYQLGVWQGRNSRATNNIDDNHLLAARVGFYPNGWINWLFAGDGEDTQKLKFGVLLSAYTDSNSHNKNASGGNVDIDGDGTTGGIRDIYETTDTGFNVALETRYKGFSADLEYGVETFEFDDARAVAAGHETEAERLGWRVALGYFVKPKKVEVVARYAQIERMKDPTVEKVADFGLKSVRVWNPDTNAFAAALEDQMTEMTVGVNWYLNAWHQHKFYVDFSRLSRSFLPTTDGGFSPEDQEDDRFRAMLQFKF